VIVEDDRIRDLVPIDQTPFEVAVARAINEANRSEAARSEATRS